MINKPFWKKYFVMTAIVWAFYAGLLPFYFHFVFGWGWSEITHWWITGTPIEFIMAYPLTRIVMYCDPRVDKWSKRNELSKVS